MDAAAPGLGFFIFINVVGLWLALVCMFAHRAFAPAPPKNRFAGPRRRPDVFLTLMSLGVANVAWVVAAAPLAQAVGW